MQLKTHERADALGHYTPAAPTSIPSPHVHLPCSRCPHSQPATTHDVCGPFLRE